MTLKEWMHTAKKADDFHYRWTAYITKQDDSPPTIHRCSSQGRVQQLCNGTPATIVSCQTRIPLRTLYKYVKIKRSNVLVTPVRRGPTPILTEDGEKHLFER